MNYSPLCNAMESAISKAREVPRSGGDPPIPPRTWCALRRGAFAVALLVVLSVFGACRNKTCDPRSDSINGYCEGNVAWDCQPGPCSTACDDDHWTAFTCTSGKRCVLVDAPDGFVAANDPGPALYGLFPPQNGTPSRYAVCLAPAKDGGL